MQETKHTQQLPWQLGAWQSIKSGSGLTADNTEGKTSTCPASEVATSFSSKALTVVWLLPPSNGPVTAVMQAAAAFLTIAWSRSSSSTCRSQTSKETSQPLKPTIPSHTRTCALTAIKAWRKSLSVMQHS